MGWAIVQADGSFRAWNRLGKTSVLGTGEQWLQMESCPDFRLQRADGQGGVRPATQAELDARTALECQEEERCALDENRMLLAVIHWIAQLHGLTPEQARTDLLTIYRARSR